VKFPILDEIKIDVHTELSAGPGNVDSASRKLVVS